MNPLIKKNKVYYLRQSFEGKQRDIALCENKKTAQERANRFILTVESHGFETAKLELRGKPNVKDGATYEVLEKLYGEFCALSDSPRPQTRKLNLSRLKLIMTRAGVETVEQIDKATLQTSWFGKKTVTESGKRTFASALRAAGSVFSVQALEYYASKDTLVKNPFKGIKVIKTKSAPYVPLSPEVAESIYRDCQTELAPHDAMIVLACQGIGLRRSEVESALFPSWFSIKDETTVLINIHENKNFIPKSGTSGIVPFDRELYNLLVKLRGKSDSPFLVPNGSKKMGAGRLWERTKVVNAWLQSKGVTNAKPLHGLRKQLGSELYQTQGALVAAGTLRNSVQVCTEYYAGLKAIPTVRITDSFKAPESPEETLAKVYGISVAELRAKLA